MPKFFVTPQQMKDNQIILTGEDEKHIKTVLRAKKGDRLTICDGFGMDYTCCITDFTSGVVTEVVSKEICDVEPQTKITLYQGLPKGDKMEWIIQKCVEIGIEHIVAVSTERTVVKLDKKETKKLERWQKISEAAAKQSNRGIIPQIGQKVMTFDEAIAHTGMLDGAIIPYEKEDKRGIREFVRGFCGKSMGIFIGPEGGFSEAEIQYAQQKGILSVTLGKRILRTETAGMTTLALLLYELG